MSVDTVMTTTPPLPWLVRMLTRVYLYGIRATGCGSIVLTFQMDPTCTVINSTFKSNLLALEGLRCGVHIAKQMQRQA